MAAFPAQFEDPYVGVAEAMHQGPDIVWATLGAHTGKPGWLLTRFELMQEVLMNPARFPSSSNKTVSDLLGMDLPLIPLESDPPIHRGHRLVIQPWFQPRAIAELDLKMRRICNELIGRFERSDGCEFVAEFSSLLPSYIFLEMMGMPIDLLPQFLEWEDTFLRGATVQAKVDAIRAVYDYLKDYSERRRQAPGEDLVSRIVHSEIDGRKLNDVEAIGMCMTLYLGGLDTTTNSLGWHVRHLATDPVLQAQLRENPELIPAAVDELSRAYGVLNVRRTVAEDMDFHGVEMRKGDVVGVPTFIASRDPREYSQPNILDLERKARHLTFGIANHHCIGIHLAKREIQIVLSEFLSRFRNIRLRDGQREVLSTERIWGMKSLPLAWDS